MDMMITLGVLRANGFRTGRPRKDGSVRAVANSFSPTTGKSSTVELIARTDGRADITVTLGSDAASFANVINDLPLSDAAGHAVLLQHRLSQ